MPLNTVTTGNTVLAADINQLVNVLQRASSQTEASKYWLAGQAYASGAGINQYMQSESKGATPVSVSTDTADQAPSNCAAPSTFHLTQYGFQLLTTATAAATNSTNVGGNTTIQY